MQWGQESLIGEVSARVRTATMATLPEPVEHMAGMLIAELLSDRSRKTKALLIDSLSLFIRCRILFG